MKKLFVLGLFFVVFVPVIFADSIVLLNGREIEGKIESEDENEVKMDIGIGIVGFSKSQISEIKRASEDEQDELENKLEQKRKEAAKAAAENERWAKKQEKRQDLISSRKQISKHDIQSRREEILKKRREQLKKLREQRAKAASRSQQPASSGRQNSPPASVPTINRGVEPVQLSAPPPPVPVKSSVSKSETSKEETTRSSRRIHRLGKKDKD
ncbi:hypothetical protein J7L67_03625 [bacterium]|nr:hypothetical protein [bacterium]